MRLFVAIDLDDEARQAIGEEQRRLAEALAGGRSWPKWVRPEHMHLTLAFLGEVEAPRSDAVIEAMAKPMDVSGPFSVTFGGLGVFPPHGSPRVLWLGVSSGAQAVIDIERAVVERLARVSIAPEERTFHPHLTLARWRDARPNDRRRVATLDRGEVVASAQVEAVTLYQSRLSSQGPAYTPLARASLVGGERGVRGARL